MNIKNRGALSNPPGRFEILTNEFYDDGWDHFPEEDLPKLPTTYSKESAKSIITRNDSPDIGFDQSINPYRGCEHGCIYCYARPAHAYMNLSPGLDFETKIFYKENSDQLLEKEINKPKYICKPIVIGANTDPYQPIENKLKITQKILQIMFDYNHPITIITKNSLIIRDIDLLSAMAKKNLVRVAISITTLSPQLKTILEPRTSTPKARLRIIHEFNKANIPTIIMAAPIIPHINDFELENILKEASKAGAIHAAYTLIRLPHEVKEIFKEWLNKHFPNRAEHVMSIIKQMRGGKEYDSTFGKRMIGDGNFAKLLAARFKLACKRYGLNLQKYASLDCSLFKPSRPQNKQIEFW